MTIQVSNLPSTVTDAQLDNLKAIFLGFGKVNKFEVIIKVKLESGEDAAVKALNGHLFEGQRIEVNVLPEYVPLNNLRVIPINEIPPPPPPPPPPPSPSIQR